MAGQVNFISNRIVQEDKVSGMGTVTVDNIAFLPNFVELALKGNRKTAAATTTSYTVGAGTAAGTHKVIVSYETGEQLVLKTVIARLRVNPEQTIAH